MQTFDFGWTPELGAAIRAAQGPDLYPMQLVKDDGLVVERLCNQGIDSHLEACNVPDRGDSYKWIRVKYAGMRLNAFVSPESLAVLVRRCLEDGSERGDYLATDICFTLDIELI